MVRLQPICDSVIDGGRTFQVLFFLDKEIFLLGRLLGFPWAVSFKGCQKWFFFFLEDKLKGLCRSRSKKRLLLREIPKGSVDGGSCVVERGSPPDEEMQTCFPLCSLKGRVIGVHTRIFLKPTQGFGYIDSCGSKHRAKKTAQSFCKKKVAWLPVTKCQDPVKYALKMPIAFEQLIKIKSLRKDD